MKKYAIMPGRHLVTTKFQEEYIKQNKDLFKELIFVVTSSNAGFFSKYNPIDITARVTGLALFGKSLGIPFKIIQMPHYDKLDSETFVTYLFKHLSLSGFIITPKNSLIISSTEPLNSVYKTLKYEILPCELGVDDKIISLIKRPHEVLAELIETEASALISSASAATFEIFPDVLPRAKKLFNIKILNEHGSLTDTRDYHEYASQMDHSIKYKYDDIKEYIQPGVIIDEGCSTGSLLKLISEDFKDSDLKGVDISKWFITEALARQTRGEFNSAFIEFTQADILAKITNDNSVNTVICNSTLHEIFSYNKQKESVLEYLKLKYNQLVPGGRVIIRDINAYMPPKHYPNILESAVPGVALHPKLAAEFKQWRKSTRAGMGAMHYLDALEFSWKLLYKHNWASELTEDYQYFNNFTFPDFTELGFKVLAYKQYLNPKIAEMIDTIPAMRSVKADIKSNFVLVLEK